MKLHISTRPVNVERGYVSVVFSRNPPGTPESHEAKNAAGAKAIINDYIARNVVTGHAHLVVRKEGRAFAGFDLMCKSIPPAVSADTVI